MESSSNQRLSDRFSDIERWMIPILLLLIVVVGVIRIIPWAEEKIFPSPIQVADVVSENSTSQDNSTIEVDLELAPVILVDGKDLPEARSEDLTNSLNKINETLTIEIQTDAADNILTNELAMDQVIVEEAGVIEVASVVNPDDPIAESKQTVSVENTGKTKEIQLISNKSPEQVIAVETNTVLDETDSNIVPVELSELAGLAPIKDDLAIKELDELNNQASNTLVSTVEPIPVVAAESISQEDLASVTEKGSNETATPNIAEPELKIELVSDAQQQATLNAPESADETFSEIPENTIAEAMPWESVNTLIDRWASAWENKEVVEYLTAYASDHKGQKHATAEQWRQWRTQRLTAPDSISIKLSDRGVNYDNSNPNYASAQFTQDYQTTNYSDTVIKRLEFKKQSSGWKIIKESTITTLNVNRS
ncbi:MAG: hypothetical protein ACI9J2_002196 [Saprospiraceae bacterium]|jgi:hypothetical protein